MEAVILVGIQATGKSTFCKDRFANSHIRLNLDMLKTRHRETILLEALLRAKQPFVVDNTNPTIDERAAYIQPAKEARFRIVGYYFKSRVADALERNARREGSDSVPDKAVLATSNRLQIPSQEEGFDELFYVSQNNGKFVIEEWSDEV